MTAGVLAPHLEQMGIDRVFAENDAEARWLLQPAPHKPLDTNTSFPRQAVCREFEQSILPPHGESAPPGEPAVD